MRKWQSRILIILIAMIIAGGVTVAIKENQKVDEKEIVKSKQMKDYSQEEREEMIGKYVKYIPTAGSCTIKGETCGQLESYDVTIENQSFSTETDVKWRIWRVDAEHIILISERAVATTKKVKENAPLILCGQSGYTNTTDILNEICKKCYSNETLKQVEVRNLTLEDIEAVSNKKLKQESYLREMNDPIREYQLLEGRIPIEEMKEKDYKDPVHYELLHNSVKNIADYYIAFQYEGILKLPTLEMNLSGVMTIQGEEIIGEALYRKDPYAIYTYNTEFAIRPVIVLPCEFYTLNTTTSGVETDMWEIQEI